MAIEYDLLLKNKAVSVEAFIEEIEALGVDDNIFLHMIHALISCDSLEGEYVEMYTETV